MYTLCQVYNYNNEVEGDEMDGACSTNMGEEERI
jgi:hypothetical protein